MYLLFHGFWWNQLSAIRKSHAGLIRGLGHFRRAVSYLLRLVGQSTDGAIHLLVRPLLADLEVSGSLRREQTDVRIVLLSIRLRLHVKLGDLVLASEVLGLLRPWL